MSVHLNELATALEDLEHRFDDKEQCLEAANA